MWPGVSGASQPKGEGRIQVAQMRIHADELQEHDLLEWDGSLIEVKYVHLAEDVQTVYWTAWDMWSERIVVLPPVHFGAVLEVWWA